MLWKFLWKPIFFSIDPEKVHHLVVNVLKLIKPFLAFNAHKYTFKYNFRNNKYLEREVFGIKFPNPVGLAAGFDKNAEIYKQMHDHGFGFIEIGTVTPKPQDGNPKKRIFRLVNDDAIINRLGFNNDGVDQIVSRLKKNKNVIIGGNIGKNKDTPNEKAADDYLICFQKLYDHVDYFAVNVSSPNTPHLRDLQNTEGLRSILIPLIDENKKRSNKPILLKISPDLNNSDILSIVDLIQELKIDGIITTNTTLSREKLKSDNKLKLQKGGLSGAPLRNRSTEVISLIHKYSKGKVPIVGVGGIMSPDDALEKLNAGASLIQVYTGFIYNGPSFIYKINREIIKSLN
ncbi:quinone-dependent dihydroorotate dehydrogenase [Flavobacteriales bacterium]|nr:quinone-dependent dihydroorotate dehydrogenase [Flavobacteriales bacterium]